MPENAKEGPLGLLSHPSIARFICSEFPFLPCFPSKLHCMTFGDSSDCPDGRENKQSWRGGHSERKGGGRRIRQRMLGGEHKNTGDGGHGVIREHKEFMKSTNSHQLRMYHQPKSC